MLASSSTPRSAHRALLREQPERAPEPGDDGAAGQVSESAATHSTGAQPSRLAWRLAWRTSVYAGVLLAVLAFAGLASPLGALLGALGAGVAVFLATRHLLDARLARLGEALRAIRQRRFGVLAHTDLPRLDELDALLWQVYRTGLVHQREIEAMRRLESYRRDFIGNVSHELKTPIFTIQGFAETLLDGALGDERVRQAFVEKIQRNALRLGNLAHDLTEIARLETSDQAAERHPFDLLRLTRDVLDALEPVAEAKQVTLRAHLPATLPPGYGDSERLRQVITNLIENGIRYNNPGGRVEIAMRPVASGRAIKVTVADNGIGIAPEHLPRLTERFYRVDTSRSRNEGGTGLGLAIVKHVLQAHGSKLLAESTPGRGTTFGFAIPTDGNAEFGMPSSE